MDILLETLGGFVWLLIGFLGVVAFSSAAREGAGLYGDPSPPPSAPHHRGWGPSLLARQTSTLLPSNEVRTTPANTSRTAVRDRQRPTQTA